MFKFIIHWKWCWLVHASWLNMDCTKVNHDLRLHLKLTTLHFMNTQFEDNTCSRGHNVYWEGGLTYLNKAQASKLSDIWAIRLWHYGVRTLSLIVHEYASANMAQSLSRREWWSLSGLKICHWSSRWRKNVLPRGAWKEPWLSKEGESIERTSCKFGVINRRIIYDSEIARHRIEGWSTCGALSFPKRHRISYHESKAREKSKCELIANTWPGVDIRVIIVIIIGVARLTQGSQQNIINFLVGLEANKVSTGCVAGSVRCPSGCWNVHHRVPYLAAHLNHDLEKNIRYFAVAAPSGILILWSGSGHKIPKRQKLERIIYCVL